LSLSTPAPAEDIRGCQRAVLFACLRSGYSRSDHMNDLHPNADRFEVEELRGEFVDALMMRESDRFVALSAGRLLR
jgi:hypothetical protein